MATRTCRPRNLEGFTEVWIITGALLSTAASITASIWTRSVMLNAPTAYFPSAASSMISLALTIDITHLPGAFSSPKVRDIDLERQKPGMKFLRLCGAAPHTIVENKDRRQELSRCG